MGKVDFKESEKDKILYFTVEGKLYQTNEQYITGANIKQLVGIPSESELYLYIKEPYNDELINNEDTVDLALPEIEGFYTKRPLHFTVNGKHFSTRKQFITGAEIREIAGLSEEKDLYLDLPLGWQDNFIENDEKVNLARPGIEKFITLDDKTIIIINGTQYEYNSKTITFEQVVTFAKVPQGNTSGYLVKYNHGPKENLKGSMSPGTTVYVQNKMIFNVASTHQS